MAQSQAGSLRGLKALVAFLGVLVVLGTAVVVGVVIKRLYAPATPASNFYPPASLAPPGAMAPPAVTATLPPGSRIQGVSAAGGVFAVWVTNPAGGEDIYLMDPATGALRLSVQAAAPKN